MIPGMAYGYGMEPQLSASQILKNDAEILKNCKQDLQNGMNLTHKRSQMLKKDTFSDNSPRLDHLKKEYHHYPSPLQRSSNENLVNEKE